MSSIVSCHNISQYKSGHLALTNIAKPVHVHFHTDEMKVFT